MADETESADAGGESATANALALAGASRAEADAFLRDQRHHLQEQLKQLSLKLWEMRLGVLLRIATAFTGLAVAAGLAYLIWNAATSNDLVIDSFQVPPDLAARGLSGPVVAAKLSDKIAAMQAQTNSQRAPKSYANGISDGLKLDIPETGVSLAELDRFLRAKLGHDLHIGGELVLDEKGIALTARIGTDGSATVAGAPADMDTLLQTLAEQVYRITQPYRYAVWLQRERNGSHVEDAIAVLKDLAAGGPAKERAWAYNGLGASLSTYQSTKTALAMHRRGHELDPENYLLVANIAALEGDFGQAEDSLRDEQTALELILAHGRDYGLPDRLAGPEHSYRAAIFFARGALLEAADEARKFMAVALAGATANQGIGQYVEALAALHEPDAARTAQAENPVSPLALSNFQLGNFHARVAVAQEAQDWAGVLAAERDLLSLQARFPGWTDIRPTFFDPLMALALAHLGRFAEAEARLKTTPGDCYPCLRARAQVAALQGQDGRADFWFARAAAVAPSSPYAETEWGRALLERKQPGAAIAHFASANKIGPHFADALEGWGEALMAQNQSHLALAKFAAAEKYAPNWGRLHLKWGEALYYAGRKDEAAKHFARAAVADLTPSEKSELRRYSASRI